MTNKELLAALSMDLKRVALGLHRKSYRMADRFWEEAYKRLQEINKKDVRPYMQQILTDIPMRLGNRKTERSAEDALMYATRIQNYVVTYE